MTCSALVISGPTGPTGPAEPGPTGPTGPAGAVPEVRSGVATLVAGTDHPITFSPAFPNACDGVVFGSAGNAVGSAFAFSISASGVTLNSGGFNGTVYWEAHGH